MCEYRFTNIIKFVQEREKHTLPRFLLNALNKGYLEIRGTELDKKLYKIYYRSREGQVNKVKVLKEITPGMVLKNEKGYLVIKDNPTKKEPEETEKKLTSGKDVNKSIKSKIVDKRLYNFNEIVPLDKNKDTRGDTKKNDTI